jgi:AcrR family transcriptional regulator
MATRSRPIPAPTAQPALILDQAALAFAELGFAAASMSDLAARCGVSKSLLYHYFTSKESILLALFDDYTRRLIALCAAIAERGLPPQAHLDALVRAFLDEYQTSQAVHKLLLQDVEHLPTREQRRIRAQERQVVEAFRGVVQAALAPRLDGAELTAATMMLLGMINWTFTWLDPKGELSYEDFATAVLAVCRGGFGALPVDATTRAPAAGRATSRTSRSRSRS